MFTLSSTGAVITYESVYANGRSGLSESVLPLGAVPPPVPVIIPPTVPTGLAFDSSTDCTITFHWTASSSSAIGYSIYVNGLLSTSVLGVTSGTVTKLLPATAYSLTVLAFDVSGNQSAQSAALVITTIADAVTPTVPIGLTAGPVTASTISFHWTPSTDDVGVAGYNIYRNTVLVGTSPTNSYTSTGLAGATPYTFNIAAYDAVPNTSAQSANLVVSTL